MEGGLPRHLVRPRREGSRGRPPDPPVGRLGLPAIRRRYLPDTAPWDAAAATLAPVPRRRHLGVPPWPVRARHAGARGTLPVEPGLSRRQLSEPIHCRPSRRGDRPRALPRKPGRFRSTAGHTRPRATAPACTGTPARNARRRPGSHGSVIPHCAANRTRFRDRPDRRRIATIAVLGRPPAARALSLREARGSAT